MKNRILVLLSTVILTLGLVTVVYAKGNSNQSRFNFMGSMMSQNNVNSNGFYNKIKPMMRNNGSYNKMIDLMKNNGFEAGVKAIQSKDYNSIANFMNNISDEQYIQMIELMKDNGYVGMANAMGSIGRENMINMQNSMMGR